MGVRKRERAEGIKEANKQIAFAKLNNCPTSPRKMRLVADLVRTQNKIMEDNSNNFNQNKNSLNNYI